jgi:hypothetical protein
LSFALFAKDKDADFQFDRHVGLRAPIRNSAHIGF